MHCQWKTIEGPMQSLLQIRASLKAFVKTNSMDIGATISTLFTTLSRMKAPKITSFRNGFAGMRLRFLVRLKRIFI